jgi:YD repeat-containing protein
MRNRLIALCAAVLSVAALPASAQLPPPPISPAPVTKLEYDAKGNFRKSIQAEGTLNLPTEHHYDSLDRRHKTTDARGKDTRFSYNGREDLTQVIDPRNLVTQYPRNGLGDVTGLISTDTGSATHSYDAAGNLKTRTDSRGVLATHTYDALSRLTSIVYTQGGIRQSFVWTYDQTGPGFSHGIGRLTSTQFSGGSSTYAYDAQGRLSSSTQVLTSTSTVSHTTSYGYDGAGRLIKLTYPSGRVLHIARTNGLPVALSVAPNASSAVLPLMSGIAVEPSPGEAGPLRSWSWHLNTGTLYQERVFDQWGRLIRYPLGGAVRDLTYDEADRISSFTHYNSVSGAAVAALDQAFAYDELGRLVSVSSGAGSWTIGYDDNGNRVSSAFTANGGTHSRAYYISPASNRLLGMSNPVRTFSHDATGNTASDIQAGVGYSATQDLSGRIVRIDSALASGFRYQTEYTHNTLGLRVLKRPISAQRCITSRHGATACSMLGAALATIYVYDPNGQLLGEYDELGGVV